MALQYKLPKQEPRDLPLSESSSTQTAKEFIRNECQIIVPFKLRVYIKGEARYLKPEQTLGEVFAMGGAVLNVNYTEAADKQRDRRKQAKATADLVRADVEREGLKNREHTTAETNRLISAFSPQFGPGEENATANQLRQRKAAARGTSSGGAYSSLFMLVARCPHGGLALNSDASLLRANHALSCCCWCCCWC